MFWERVGEVSLTKHGLRYLPTQGCPCPQPPSLDWKLLTEQGVHPVYLWMASTWKDDVIKE